MQIKEIPLKQIFVSLNNTRKDLESGTDEITLDDLAHSIRKFGLMSPITVTQKGDKYEIIAGQRRFLACQKIEMSSIPCIIRENIDESEAITLSLIENVQRSDMSPIDKSKAYSHLLKNFEDITILSNYVGVGVPTIRKYLSLMELSPIIQERIDAREGTLGIESLSKLSKIFPNHDEQEKIFDKLKPYNQKVQIEIIKRTGGDINKLESVETDAQAGLFEMKICTRGLCDLIPPDFEEKLREDLQHKRKMTWLELFTRVGFTAVSGLDLGSSDN